MKLNLKKIFFSSYSIYLYIGAFALRMIILQIIDIPFLLYMPIELVLLLLVLYFERQQLGNFFIRRKKIFTEIYFGIAVAVLWCAIEYLLNFFVGEPFKIPHLNSLLLFPVLLIIAGWKSALYEELLFRSITMGVLIKVTKNGSLAIFIQALCFYVAHASRYFHAGSWYQSFFVGLTGLFVGYITYKRRSIIPAIIIHSFINTYGAIFMPAGLAWHKAIFSWLK